MSVNIDSFLTERKNAWLKNKIKDTADEQQKAALVIEAEEKFALENWLLDAARRAKQLVMVSHPAKFSHPSAKVSPVIAQQTVSTNGYLCSGNLVCEPDVLGNAAALDVYKFLMILMEDGQTVLTHFENDTPMIQAKFKFHSASYEQLKQDLLAIKYGNEQEKPYTDQLIKQIYFPVTDSYHLLSILSPSGLMAAMKTAIDKIRFSETAKNARACLKKNEYHEQGFDDIYNLTLISYGGTKPQNISVLNNQYGGKFYLLASVPPKVEKRYIRLPRYNFFKNTLRLREFKESFQSLHRLAICEKKNRHIEQGVFNIIDFLIDRILEKAFHLRNFYEQNWSAREYYQALPRWQKIWLDSGYQEQREAETAWLTDVSEETARWILKAYETNLKQQAIKMGTEEWNFIKEKVMDKVNKAQEFFK